MTFRIASAGTTASPVREAVDQAVGEVLTGLDGPPTLSLSLSLSLSCGKLGLN